MDTVIHPDYTRLQHFLASLPETFEQSDDMVYESRNQLKKFEVDGLMVIVKRFKVPNFINRIAYSFIRPSKARRAYEYALKLISLGINSPQPIAYMENRKGGLLHFSYFISVFETEFTEVREIMEGFATNDDLLDDLAAYIAHFHDKGVLHLDMSPGNIMYKKDGEHYIFTLIDINRMQFWPSLSKEKRFKSFKRLTEFEPILTRMAKVYAREARLNETECIREINKHSHAFFNSRKFKRRLE